MNLWRRKGAGKDDGQGAQQDSTMGLLENGLGSIDDPRFYLARSTSNKLVDHHCKRSILSFLSLDEVQENEHPKATSPEATASMRALTDGLMAALQELPPKCRQVYVYHRLEGWTHTEIAQTVGLSRSMVEKYMQRAHAHIHERLHQYSPY